jgi:hypothetical protein
MKQSNFQKFCQNHWTLAWRWLKRWLGLAMGNGGDAGEEDDLAR